MPTQPSPEQPLFPSLEFDRSRQRLTVAEVMQKLCCSKQHVINLIDCGKLRAVDIGTGAHRYYVIPREAYDEMIRNNTL